MPIQTITIGSIVPIELQIGTGAIDQYPRALVYDQDSVLLTTIDLIHDNQGNYSGTPYIMPDKLYIKVVFIVYSDALFTVENIKYERPLDIFYSSDWVTLTMGQKITNLLRLIFVNTNGEHRD